MPNKRSSFFLAIAFAVCIMLFVPACKVEPLPKPVWPSLNFAGVFSGNDICLISGTQPDSITITATATAQVSISNLYGSGKSFTGTVSNDTCYIQPQVYNNVTGNAVMQGSFVMAGDTINLAIIISTFGQEDKCNAVLVKK